MCIFDGKRARKVGSSGQIERSIGGDGDARLFVESRGIIDKMPSLPFCLSPGLINRGTGTRGKEEQVGGDVTIELHA